MTEILLRAAGRSGEVVLRRVFRGPERTGAEGAGRSAGPAHTGRRGGSTVLELIVNGVFLMDSGRDGASERLLAAATLARCPTAGLSCLVGGLGFGYTLAEIAALRPGARITCVELEPAILDCLPLVAEACGHPAGLATDPRVRLVAGDVFGWAATTAERYHAVLLDIDNGPSWLVRPQNGRLYRAAGLRALARVLLPGGVLGVWSAQPEAAFAARLARHIGPVEAVAVPHASGAPDVIYLAARRAGGAGGPAGPAGAAP